MTFWVAERESSILFSPRGRNCPVKRLWSIAIGAPNVFDGDIGNIYIFFDYKVKSGGITCQSSPHFIYFGHEIRSKHQLLVVAGPIVRSLVFLVRFSKEAGSSKGANFFAKILETRQRT
jgi:hypothetical protein